MKKTLLLLILSVFLTNLFAAGGNFSTYTYNLHKGWNLIGVFLEPTSASEKELLSHQLFEFQRQGAGGVFSQETDVKAGKAYWIYMEKDDSLTVQGYPVGNLVPGGDSESTDGAYRLTESLYIDAGTMVTRTAPDVEGYLFTEWSVSGVSLPAKTAKTISFTMPANAVTLTPNYEKSTSAGKTYMVVTLSTGEVRYTDTAPNLNDDTCRTTELWLRRIPKGTFTMGSPEDEVKRHSDETRHQVTLTQDYYIGVFEMTQKQYELIYGSNPSCYNGDCRPVENVTYYTICGTGGTAGAGWPAYGHAVGDGSFLGKLRAKTGLVFDLPTEAQWEYACRAGTTTALNTGRNLTSTGQDPAMDEAGRYGDNLSDGKGGYEEHTKVGSYLPNAWGLYDMHGNVVEWCLDWYGSYPTGSVTDPAGAQTGFYRVLRGGSWCYYAQGCRSASRDSDYLSGNSYPDYGFRVVCLPSVVTYTLAVDGGEKVSRIEGEMVTVTAPDKSGYEFKNWTASGITLSTSQKTSPTISFTMPANAVTLTPNYEKSTSAGKTYMVVTLSTGEVRYTDTAPNLNDDTCRTTELWLRRIPKGTFTMGSPTNEVGRWNAETQHQVTLTQDYYIGVFEMTQKQYELIYGSNPSYYEGDCRPVERVSYNDIRGTGATAGAGWPAYGHAVDDGSFLGKLRAKTGLVFDLPTEAQWEYACRAGTTTALNTGKNLMDEVTDPAMDEAGRYGDNLSDGKGGYEEHTKVGSYLPNAWGLYDMHGNVFEWCLDWYGSYPTGSVTDPEGAQTGSYRVNRGSHWYCDAQSCRSALRGYDDPSNANVNGGFRVVCLPQ